MKLVLLPGMDGTGLLFRPLVEALPPELDPLVVAYPADVPRTYDELLPVVRAALSTCPVPLLYLAGSRDRIVRPHNVALILRLRPDVELITLDAPHLLLQSAPAAAAAIATFSGAISGVRSCSM